MADTSAARSSAVVSSESERLILVDSQDNEIGFENKGTVHDGNGILHRAFSLFIFNRFGELLMQQRSGEKRLWPLHWSNSCCSHPREGEEMDDAIHRRLFEELGMKSELKFLFRFRYHAQYGELGAEHEFCWVYVGRSNDDVVVNDNEIADWHWTSSDALNQQIAEEPETLTPWFRLEWERINTEFSAELEAITSEL